VVGLLSGERAHKLARADNSGGKTMQSWLFLSSARKFDDAALLLMRIVVGSFLVWGVMDNVLHTERMQEFVVFLAKFGFPAPELLAPLSVWVQLVVGMCFVLGLMTRWAGVLCVINFIIAVAMVDRFGGFRGSFASVCLILIGLYLATHGAGRYSVDARVARN
jgi:putative oxidoreductase